MTYLQRPIFPINDAAKVLVSPAAIVTKSPMASSGKRSTKNFKSTVPSLITSIVSDFIHHSKIKSLETKFS